VRLESDGAGRLGLGERELSRRSCRHVRPPLPPHP